MQAPLWMSMADPIHGMIRLKRHNASHRLLLDVMNSLAFQRLRRIKQMGMAEFVFPGATHNRFVHSIGATWLMIKALDHFYEYEDLRRILKSPYEDTDIPVDTLLLVSILVHDIGHTPLSHTLEDILDLKGIDLLHDTYWNRLILEHDQELQQIWAKYGYPELGSVITRFNGFDGVGEYHFLADLVSSQLDMDRLDYLLRDSHYLGVQYGRIEVERIILNLMPGKTPDGRDAIGIREEAVPAVEHYLFGRYEAYKMALHSLDKASETLMKKTLERFKAVRELNVSPGEPANLLYQLMTDGRSLSVNDYLMLDDCYLWDKINLWARYSEDLLLKQLATRLLAHDLFKYVEVTDYLDPVPPEVLTDIRQQVEAYYLERGLSMEYGYEEMTVTPKPLYQTVPNKPPIWVRKKDGMLTDFATMSSLAQYGETGRDQRVLLFLWDKEAQVFVRKLISKRYKAS